MATMPKQGGAK